MWLAFVAFFCFAPLIALSNLGGPEPVSRVEAPSVGSQPMPPVVGGNLERELSDISEIYPGDYGVAVYNPRSGRRVEIEASRPVEAGSLAKLPVFLTLYKEAAEKKLSLNDEITMRASDIQAYGTGILHTRHPVGYEMTLRECARTMIKYSDNTAWVMLERRLGKENISRELESIGADGTDYAEYRTTPEDVMLVLRAISAPSYTSPGLSSEMLGAMTDTTYEGRIPAPLPKNVEVAHKIGTLEGTYSDAGFVFGDGTRDPEDGYFIVVVASSADKDNARDTIRKMSLAAYESLGSEPE